MDKDTKLVSVRLPLEDYQEMKEMSDLFGVSVSTIIKTSIHVGLIIAKGALDKKAGEQDGERKG